MSSFEPHFQHRQSAHCESGVMASLLSHAGLPMSEPMAFGLASGLAFAYLPIVKLSGMPLIAYRMPPRHLIKTLSKRLGARLNSRTFGNPEQGRRELDALLDQGRLAGLQSSVFWLPYLGSSPSACSTRQRDQSASISSAMIMGIVVRMPCPISERWHMSVTVPSSPRRT